MIQARNIHVNLGHKKVLRGIDFEALSGEVTAIVGPNGSGKTTLLRAIIGEIGYSGQVSYNGRSATSFKTWELAALRGVLPQINTIAFPFTVIEIVRMGQIAGLSAVDTDIPFRALERVDLAGFADRFYQDLSGGEQQRVQLARVLAQVWAPVINGAPRWLFLDEPVTGLDIGHQFVVMDIAKEFAAQGGGVVAIMHDLNLTAMFADKVAVIHTGKVAIYGPPKIAITDSMLLNIYNCPVQVNTPPLGKMSFVLPQARIRI